MQPVTIRLPFPPSTNNIFAGKTRRYPTRAYRVWRRQAELEIMAARVPRMSEPVRISIKLFPRDGRARDADNYIKAIQDSLVRMQVIADDQREFVRGVSAEWGSVANPPIAEVCITAA